MTILLAPDKFKGSLAAEHVCQAIAEGILQVNPSWNIISCPLADGGEGTADLLTAASHGKKIKVNVLDPLFREIEASYGISRDGQKAFIEMAKASGLGLLKPEERNPLFTTSFGTGQLILHAILQGVRHIVLGIGGTATNDAGIGMAEALGFSFYDENKNTLKPFGKNLLAIHSIGTSQIHPGLKNVKFTVLCDVTNPLYGEQGAAHIFGPQKGANAANVLVLDRGLRQFAAIAESAFSVPLNFPGAGAAGGVGAGARAFLNATVEKGFEFISQFMSLESKITQADEVITGEGKMDIQSLSGKVVSGVARLARRHQKKCMAFAGKCELNEDQIQSLGLQRVVTLVDSKTTEEVAERNAYGILVERTVQAFPKRP